MIASFFKLAEHGTSWRTEAVAGLTTFLAMSYIVFVQPLMLIAPFGVSIVDCDCH